MAKKSKEDEQVEKGVGSINYLIKDAANAVGSSTFLLGMFGMTIVFIVIQFIKLIDNDLIELPLVILCGVGFSLLYSRLVRRYVGRVCKKYYIKINEEDKEK